MAEVSGEKRGSGGRFLPGNAPKSPGRPKVFADHRALCQKFMTDEGWELLQELARNPKAKDRYKALELLAAYAVGKPTQLVAGDASMDPISVTLTDADLRNLADFALGGSE